MTFSNRVALSEHNVKKLFMTDAAGRQLFTKAIRTEATEPAGTASPRSNGMNPKGPKCNGGRGVTIDPNAYRAPFNRARSPRDVRNRRRPGWTARWFVLPKLTVEGLRTLAIQFAQAQQHSDWPRERLRYPRSVNFFVIEAVNDYFRRLGFEQFCVEEQKPARRCVRRFIAPNE